MKYSWANSATKQDCFAPLVINNADQDDCYVLEPDKNIKNSNLIQAED